MIIVTSGAVGVGCHRLGLANKPTVLAKKQALAAVGQVHLMKFYEDFLQAVGLVSMGVGGVGVGGWGWARWEARAGGCGAGAPDEVLRGLSPGSGAGEYEEVWVWER